MKVIATIFAVMMLSSFTSCSTYKLDDKDIALNPYKVNDILIFRNNVNECDTVLITGIERHTNPTHPLSFFADRTETLFVTARHGDLEGPLLKISRTKDSVYIDHTLTLKDAMFYSAFLTTVELRKLKPETVRLFEKEYSSVVKIHSLDKEKRYDLAKSIYWSNEYGYVKTEMSNGKYWYLVERIRNNHYQ